MKWPAAILAGSILWLGMLCPSEARDLLTLYAQRHPAMECLDGTGGDGQCLEEARYRVPGSWARTVEAFLQNRFDMAPLVFSCCGWDVREGIAGTFRSQDRSPGGPVTITMYSHETPVNRRDRWNEIPWFYVLVRVWNL